MGRLEGRVAVVTGSTRGIGRAIAEASLAEGARLVINSRSAEAAAAAASELGGEVVGVGADVSDAVGAQLLVDAAVKHFGRLDIMVCNAGRSIVRESLDLEPEEWRSVLALNLDGVFYCAQRAARVMLPQGGGCILSIASIASFNAFPRRAAYNTSKAGVAMLTRVLATEWAPAVRVNAIAPGYVRTDLIEELRQSGQLDYEAVTRRTPMGRLGETHEIAAAAVFVASPDASFMTGETLVIDGGWNAYGFV